MKRLAFSVHGANRLGGNSLLDLVVFGRAAGLQIEQNLKDGFDSVDASASDIDLALSRLDRLNNSTSGESVATLRADLQNTMQLYFGVFREGASMQKGLKLLDELGERIANLHLGDKDSGILILPGWKRLSWKNLYQVACATAISAEARNGVSRCSCPQ